jgi:cation diffusion facilitator CzcD-associated flavoprotein CzcO
MSADFDVGIVGSGFAGLAMAHALQREGKRSFVLLEKNDAIGGTWWENRYPGCACDIPSHMYSYSFALNADWSRTFAPQGEILAYIRRWAARADLERHVRFGAQVKAARFDGEGWRVTMGDGDELRVRQLVLGVGALNRPLIPDLPGLDRFAGEQFHSARWNHSFELKDKRVAVIGTGASAIQFVPRIAPQVRQLHLFQRTPAWILPRPDRRIPERTKWVLRHVPGANRALRNWLYLSLDLRSVAFTVEPRLLRAVAPMCRRFIAKQIRDPELRRKVTPSYTPGCKRLLMANDYYPTLERDNVELVTDGIEQIDEHAVVTRDGRRREVDALIFGTGFRVTELLANFDVHGRGGVDIHDVWRERVEAYLGTSVAGFPNLFMLTGPNTGLGHNSMVFIIESQVDYVMRCLERLDRRGASWMDVRHEAQRAFNDGLRRRLGRTVWASGCRSWYLDASGHNPTLWPGSTSEFWLRTRRVHEADYDFG